jgi:hypothetical protein
VVVVVAVVDVVVAVVLVAGDAPVEVEVVP